MKSLRISCQLFLYHTKINALLKDKCRLQSMSKNTRDNFERFEMENIIKKWKNIFERLEK